MAHELKPAPDVVSRRLYDEVVLVNLQTNTIYALNRTGARFWEMLAEGNDRAEIERRLLSEFDVSPDRLSVEVDELLARLSQAGLIDEATA